MDLDQRIAALSPERRALLERALIQQTVSDAGEPAIPRRAERDDCPLSFAQQRLWFLDQLHPGSPVYNVPVAIRLSGALSLPALRHSLDAILARHEALRTAFPARGGVPVQHVAPVHPVPLALVDLAAADEPEAEAGRRIAAEAEQPFDLSRGPLFRATLLRLGDDEHILLLMMHHLVTDGWSVDVLFRELGALYPAFVAGRPAPLPELPIQYPDYSVWQREWLQGERLAAQLEYWKQRLGADLPPLTFPTDHPRPAVQTFRGASESFCLASALTTALKELSQREGVTLFMTLLAAFQILLARHSGQKAVVVGTPAANRSRVEIEGLIGFFANTLALRTDLSGDPSFRELLQRVREVALGAFAHQDLPFEKLVEVLQPGRNLSHSPLFEVMFVLQSSLQTPLVLPGLTVRHWAVDTGTAKFDLTLGLSPEGEALRGLLEYNTDLFETATIQRLAGQFQTLLAGIVAEPDQSIARLPLLTDAERHRLLVEWNQTAADYPRAPCLHHGFEAQVEQRPDAVAVVYEGQRLTYHELNARANQLAHFLRRQGVGPGALVGLCVERSLEMVVGLLAILKAGGAYVPLDPDYPTARLAFMLADSGVSLLLTQERLVERLQEPVVPLVCLDARGESMAGESQENLALGLAAESLAYVIYTSGSTGTPKGVRVSHANVVRLFQATQAWFHFDDQDVWTLFHSTAFDFSVWELWGALLYGGRLVVVPYGVSRSPQAFYDQLCTEGVTVLNQTPSAFRQLMQAEAAARDAARLNLRLIIFGGEALDRNSLEPWLARHGDQHPRLVNMYGITETTVHATCHPLASTDRRQTGGSIIGRPLPDLQLYLLDQHRQPVPVGVAGEIYIGGAGVAQGYHRRPGLTAERFIPHPFGSEPGARLYRTGDQARYLPNGNLEFLGRIDQQVKIRGFRIELGEIEAALTGHPAVGEAVVLAHEMTPDDVRLMAYLVPNGHELPPEPELRRFLRSRLPEYMLPAAFVRLPALPLTPTGKVDRRALPAPEGIRPELQPDFVAPRNPWELQLTRIWENVLGVGPIGVHDNFFDLGGHSLLAVRLFAEIEKASGQALPLATLFQAPTVGQLAAVLNREAAPADWSCLVSIQPTGRRPPLFCIHSIGGNVLGYRKLARLLGPDQPVYGLQAQGLDGKRPPFTRIEPMAAHYLREIRSLQPEGPYYLAGASFGGVVAFEMARQLSEQGQEVGLLVLLDTYGPDCWRTPQGAIRRIGGHLRVMRGLEPTARLHYLRARVCGVGMKVAWQVGKVRSRFLQDRTSDLPPALIQVERIHRQALQQYVPPCCPIRVTLMRARERPVGAPDDWQMGWGRVAAGGVDIYEVPGDHVSMLQQSNIEPLIQQLKACLEKAQSCADPIAS